MPSDLITRHKLLLSLITWHVSVRVICKDNNSIKCKQENEPVRYLVIWISGRKNDKFIKNQCNDEILITTNRLKWKKITSQQIVYVFNAVIIPRIEYRTNLTILKHNYKLQHITTQLQHNYNTILLPFIVVILLPFITVILLPKYNTFLA